MSKASEPSKDRRSRATTGSLASDAADGSTAPAAKGVRKPVKSEPKTGPPSRPGVGGRSGPRPALTGRAAILALVVCVIALSLAYPLREYIAQRSEIAQLQDQRARTIAAVEELSQRHEELQDPAHIEREARSRLHYQYPDEQAYVILGDDPAAPEDRAPSDPWFTELWKSVLEADKAESTSD